MVNYGVSQACLTCKKRRIKCDEQKPNCRRCIKSKRTCLGYKENADILFRDYKSCGLEGSVDYSKPPLQASTASDFPPNLDGNADTAALKSFFQDYVLVSKDRSLSRGYFDGLESLLNSASPSEELISAAKIVAHASAASKTGTLDLVSSTDKYSNALAAFQKMLDNPEKRNADEALMTAVLLGLYEMIVAAELYPSAHNLHLKGVSAILCTRKVPFDLLDLAGANLFELFNPLLPARSAAKGSIPGLLSPYPCSETDPPMKSLDVLLIKSRPVLERASQILSDPKATKVDLRTLKQDASLLNKEYSLWPLCQPKEWLPRTLGVIQDEDQFNGGSLSEKLFWPGNVDSYFDLYVSAVWNTYRKARLKLLHVIARSSERINPSELTNRKLEAEMQELVDDMCASVPFHLVADLPSALHKPSDMIPPGKALGGLFLMYTMYIASSLPMVPSKQRFWMRGRLRWIGTRMGIRQASMLADVGFKFIFC